MEYCHNRAKAVRELLAPDGTWTLGEVSQRLLSDSLARLPRRPVSDAERRYPISQAGLRAFLDAFFARHYFQVQDSLVHYFASPAFDTIVRRGILHIADIGCGPGVAALAIAELAAATLRTMNADGRFATSHITIHCTVNDTSDVCLNEARRFLARYNGFREGRISIGHVIPVSTPFPNSIVQFCRIGRMMMPYDICCLGYVVVPLSEQMGVTETAQSICRLSRAGNAEGGQLLMIQDKFQRGLLRRICRKLSTRTEMAELRQRVYDSENQNSEHTYTYCRAVSTISDIRALSFPVVA